MDAALGAAPGGASAAPGGPLTRLILHHSVPGGPLTRLILHHTPIPTAALAAAAAAAAAAPHLDVQRRVKALGALTQQLHAPPHLAPHAVAAPQVGHRDDAVGGQPPLVHPLLHRVQVERPAAEGWGRGAGRGWQCH